MADDQCIAPDGRPYITIGLGPSTRTLIIVVILASLPLTTILLGPKLFFYVGGRFGSYLRRRTAAQRERLLQVTGDDEKDFLARAEDKSSGDEWEEVDAAATGSANNGDKADPEWDGFVGFFHPFW
jgi:alpha-1,2-mannosyltransferase